VGDVRSRRQDKQRPGGTRDRFVEGATGLVARRRAARADGAPDDLHRLPVGIEPQLDLDRLPARGTVKHRPADDDGSVRHPTPAERP